MNELIAFLVSGAVAGGLYAVLASGLVLGYATSGVFNFAYGAMAYVVAVLYYELNTGLHWSQPAAAVVSIVVFAPLLGLLLDRLMFSRLSRSGSTAQIVATIGLMIALPGAAIFTVDRLRSVGGFHIPGLADVTSPPGLGPNPEKTFLPLRGVTIDTNQLAIFGAALFAAIALWLVVRHTRLGLHMRATVDRRTLAGLRGVDPDRTSMIAWMVAGTIAGLIGVLAAPVVTLSADAFTSMLLVAASAAVFARLRSIPIAFASGLGLGIVENLVAGYVEPHVGILGLPSAVPFIILFLGLFFLNRSRSRSAGTTAEEAPASTVGETRSGWQAVLPWALVVVAFCVYLFVVASSLWVDLIAGGLALSLVFLSFVIVTGIGGMVSLAQATFVLSAATVAGWVLSEHQSFLVALVAGTAVAAVVGVLMALPALRLGGLTLALATLALAYVGADTVFQLNGVGNDNLGWSISRPDFLVDFGGSKAFSALLLVIIGLVVLLIWNLRHSASGRSMLAVRSSQVAAEASGVSSVRVKLALFALAAGLAGFGGIFYGAYTGIVSPSDFPPAIGLVWLAVVVTFGVRRPGYAVVAGVVYGIFPHVLSYVTTSQQLPDILFGLGGMALARNPDGFLADAADSMRQLAGVLKKRAKTRRLAAPPLGEAVVALGRDGAGVRAAGARSRVEVGGLQAGSPIATSKPDPHGTDEMNGREAVLSVERISTGYEGTPVLTDFTMAVGRGKVVALVGANGGGKTTLCNAIAGVIPLWSGRVLLEGVDCTRWPSHRRARAGIVLAPEAKGIFPALTVEENLRLALEDRLAHEEVYEHFPRLAERRSFEAGMLSGGEQQMLTLAPVVIKPPKVLVADEPSLGLSPLVTAEVMRLLTTLRERGTAIVVVEERVRDVLEIADEVVVVDNGRLSWAGPASEIDLGQVSATYLGRRAVSDG